MKQRDEKRRASQSPKAQTSVKKTRNQKKNAYIGPTAKTLKPLFAEANTRISEADREQFFALIKKASLAGKSQVRWHSFGQAIMASSLLVAATGITMIIVTAGFISLPTATGILQAFQLTNQAVYLLGMSMSFFSALTFFGGLSAYGVGSQKRVDTRQRRDDIKYVMKLKTAGRSMRNRSAIASSLAPIFREAQAGINEKSQKKLYGLVNDVITRSQSQVRWHLFGQVILGASVFMAVTGITMTALTAGLISHSIATGVLQAFQVSNSILFAFGVTLTALSIFAFMGGLSVYQKGGVAKTDSLLAENDVRSVLGLDMNRI